MNSVHRTRSVSLKCDRQDFHSVGYCKTFGRKCQHCADLEVLEGEHAPRRLIVFEFPSMEALRAFWQSAEYAAVKLLRAGAAHRGNPNEPP